MKNNIFHQRTPKKHTVFHFFVKKKMYFFSSQAETQRSTE